MALASLTLLLILAGYALLCAASPFGICRKCRGFGFATHTDRKGRPTRGKRCRRCKGHGKRVRAGRRLLTTARATHHTGTR
ncbi:hypothetical protein [Streptomyces roseolilacinus]|uniref:Uncharacterized protein n=1 Tax=Streptomyces roseolilacinus TaxID=66904 RepID=A0A918EL92_9ACTN|nr:hypothetical protein [Streptomyces roseolilacinus]GGQ12313.1 hypothetical protein GCM10010249_33700 [Streptomyces roseolilacinus]